LHAEVRGATLVRDRFGADNRAYRFGVGQDIIVPRTETRNYLPITVSMWYYLDADARAAQNLFSKYVTASFNGVQLLLAPRGEERNVIVPWYLANNADGVLGDYGESPFYLANLGNNRWHHLVFVVDQSGGRLYANGQLVGTHPWRGAPTISTNNYLWKIGGNYETSLPMEFFEGRLDEIRVFSRALSSADVITLYALERRP
jgi:hypothetical protein